MLGWVRLVTGWIPISTPSFSATVGPGAPASSLKIDSYISVCANVLNFVLLRQNMQYLRNLASEKKKGIICRSPGYFTPDLENKYRDVLARSRHKAGQPGHRSRSIRKYCPSNYIVDKETNSVSLQAGPSTPYVMSNTEYFHFNLIFFFLYSRLVRLYINVWKYFFFIVSAYLVDRFTIISSIVLKDAAVYRKCESEDENLHYALFSPFFSPVSAKLPRENQGGGEQCENIDVNGI